MVAEEISRKIPWIMKGRVPVSKHTVWKSRRLVKHIMCVLRIAQCLLIFILIIFSGTDINFSIFYG